jgi:ELWxxDGT repeat protein
MSIPRRVATIPPGNGVSTSIQPIGVELGGSLFFSTYSGSSGSELWKTDGYSASRVADFNSPFTFPLTTLEGSLFIQSFTGLAVGAELWKTDGSIWKTDGASTSRVASPAYFISTATPGNKLFYTTTGGPFSSSSGELWQTDGTTSSRIADFSPNFIDSSAAVGGSLFLTSGSAFSGGRGELWKTDGTTANRIADFSPNIILSSTAVGGILFFTSGSDIFSGGKELWKTDGTSTNRIANFSGGISSIRGFSGESPVIGTTLFFAANDGSSGWELWKSDGTTTSLVADINPGSASSYPTPLTAVGGSLFFATSTSSFYSNSGFELWKTDGTTTNKIGKIPSSSSASLVYIQGVTAVGGSVFLSLFNWLGGPGIGAEIWKTDGSNTNRVVGLPSGLSPGTMALGDIALFGTYGSSGAELWALDPDLPYTPGSITINGVNLGTTSGGYALRDASATQLQITYPGGNASASNPGSGWSAVAAAPSSGGSAYALYWRNSDSGQTARWDLNSSGAYTSGYLLSAAQLISEEANLNLDLNGDGYTSGARTISGVNLGTTSLGYALRNGSSTPIQVTYPGGNASSSNPGAGWSAVAAAPSPTGGGFAFYWRNRGSGQTARWDLNSSGAYSSGTLLSAAQLISEEANLNLDLNGDGYTSGLTTFNGVNLGSTALGYALRNGSSTPIQVTYPGGNASSSNPGAGWSAVAAAPSPTGGGFAFYWRNSGSGQAARWDLNSSGAYTSGTLLSAAQLISEEANLNLDLNGDGYTSGARTINGVNLGSTSLGYALRSGTGSPIQVTYPGGIASASNPGNNWVALAAAPIPSSTGFAFYWRNNSSGDTARWDLNASGAYQTGTLLTASQLINEEVAINADLSGDAIIGSAFTTLESKGGATLLRNSDGKAWVREGSDLYTVASPFGLGTGDSTSTWQMLAAETIGEKNQILWRNNPGNFLHVWSLDASWSWQSSAGSISPSSPEALGLETSFQIDLNGNGLIG